MENNPIKSQNHFFLYIILLFVIVVGTLSYYRFLIKHDYNVSYDGQCDPATESCFVNYGDDEGAESMYYSKMQKYAPDLYRECGSNITDCEEASMCLPGDRNCSRVYCDKNNTEDNCSTPPHYLQE
jgi:hypothetical protein